MMEVDVEERALDGHLQRIAEQRIGMAGAGM